MYCENCGQKVNDVVNYCENCGAVIRKKEKEYNKKNKPNKTKLSIIALFLLLTIIPGIPFVYGMFYTLYDPVNNLNASVGLFGLSYICSTIAMILSIISRVKFKDKLSIPIIVISIIYILAPIASLALLFFSCVCQYS